MSKEMDDDLQEFAQDTKLEVDREPPRPPAKTAIGANDDSRRTTLLLYQKNENIRRGLTKFLNVRDVYVVGQTDKAFAA